MQLQVALELFLRHYTNAKTRYNNERLLLPLIQWLGTTRDVDRVTPIEIHEWIAQIHEQPRRFENHHRHPTEEGGLSPYTIHGRIKSIQTFFNWLVKMEVIDAAKNPVRNVEQKPLPSYVPEHRIATDEEIELITRVLFGHPRNYAMFLFMRDTGCRAMEVAGLTLNKLSLDHYCAEVLGKGSVWRESYFGEDCAVALRGWLKRRPQSPHVYVFCATRSPYAALTPTAVSDMVERAALKAGIERPIHSHHIRHWRATNLVRQQVDIPTAAAAIGDTIEVFQAHYLHTSRDRVQEAVKRTAYKSRQKTAQSIPNVISLIEDVG